MTIRDEVLDIVDENDHVIGKKKRSEIYEKGLSNFRVVNLFIRNTQNRLWLPRRKKDKRIFPLCLDVSMGGHVECGESYEEALKRELKEELNISLKETVFVCLGYLMPHVHDVSAFMKVYEIRMDGTPRYNQEDFCEFFWLTPRDALGMIEKGEPCKEDLPKLINLFYPVTAALSSH